MDGGQDRMARAKELMALWLEGELASDQAAELDELLQDDGVQQEFRAAVQLHVDLAHVLLPGLRPLSADELLRLQGLEQPTGDRSRLFPAVTGGSASGSWKWVVPCAIGLLFALLLLYRNTRTVGPGHGSGNAAAQAGPVIARITRTASSEITADGQATTLGLGEMIEFEHGLLELEFKTGVRLVFSGPSRFRIDSANSVELEYGDVSGIVPEQGTGFRIRTADGIVEDLGTEFGVRVVPGERRMEVAVYKGEVRVFEQGNPAEPVNLLEGKQLEIANGIIQSVGDIVREAKSSFDRPTLSLEADADSFIQGGKWSDVNSGDDPLLLVKRDELTSLYNRRALLRFRLPDGAASRIKAARLVLTVCPNTIASDLHPDNQVADCRWRFSVAGIWDRDWQPWDERTVTWRNAPGHRPEAITGVFFRPEAPVELAEFSVHRHGVAGQQVEVSGPALLRFLQEDEDGSVSLIVSRLTGYRWSSPGSGGEDRVVHSFASREHGGLPAPRLELWLQEDGFGDRDGKAGRADSPLRHP